MDICNFRLAPFLPHILLVHLDRHPEEYYDLCLVSRRFRSVAQQYCRRVIAHRNCRKGKWPSHLESLQLSEDYFFSAWIERSRWWNVSGLPRTLTSLNLGEDFDRPLDFSELPDLRHLRLSDRYNRPLPTSQLPRTLISLDLGVDFNQEFSVPGLPRGLSVLIFSKKYLGALEFSQLPRQLVRLVLPPSYSCPGVDVYPSSWPASLTEIIWDRGDYQISLLPLWRKRWKK